MSFTRIMRGVSEKLLVTVDLLDICAVLTATNSGLRRQWVRPWRWYSQGTCNKKIVLAECI